MKPFIPMRSIQPLIIRKLLASTARPGHGRLDDAEQSCNHDYLHPHFPQRPIACQSPFVRTLWLFAENQDGIGVQPEELPFLPDDPLGNRISK